MFKKLNKMQKIMVIILIAFIIWMLFFDENSYLIHRELNTEIKKLEESTKYYKTEIKKNKKMMDNLNNPKSLEKFARETYKMKKKNEDIFIVEFDSIKSK